MEDSYPPSQAIAGASMLIWGSVCICADISVYTYISYLYTYVYIYIYTYVYMYMSYINMYRYIYMYVYIYIECGPSQSRARDAEIRASDLNPLFRSGRCGSSRRALGYCRGLNHRVEGSRIVWNSSTNITVPDSSYCYSLIYLKHIIPILNTP